MWCVGQERKGRAERNIGQERRERGVRRDWCGSDAVVDEAETPPAQSWQRIGPAGVLTQPEQPLSGRGRCYLDPGALLHPL